jgi:hypothetical protein
MQNQSRTNAVFLRFDQIDLALHVLPPNGSPTDSDSGLRAAITPHHMGREHGSVRTVIVLFCTVLCRAEAYAVVLL